MPRLAAAALVVLALATGLPAQAKPGGSLKAYRTYVAKTLNLRPRGTKHVDGGTASDWYYTFHGTTHRGLPLELTIQAGADRIYSQALTITTRAGDQAAVADVVTTAEGFWAEATDGHGKAMSKAIAPKIAAGLPEGTARYKDVTASLTKVAAGDQVIFVVGAEYRPAGR